MFFQDTMLKQAISLKIKKQVLILIIAIPINDTSNFEAGLKFSAIKTKSNIIKIDIDVNTGDEQIDLQNSDAFNYDENVFAAYSN